MRKSSVAFSVATILLTSAIWSHAETGPCELNARSRRLAAQALQEKAAQLSPLVLVNASAGADLAPLVNGTNDLPQLDGVNVRYDAPAGTQSVKFKYDTRTSVENSAPYALFGDSNGRYNAGSIPAGAHVITATAYNRKNARGKIVGSVSVKADFQVQPGPTPDPTPTPTPDPSPGPAPTPVANCFGYFALQPVNDTGRIKEADLRQPNVVGLTIRFKQNADGSVDFAYVDSRLQLARKTGDKYTLLMIGGGANPLDAAVLASRKAAAQALGARYASDTLCVGVHVAVPPQGHSEELFWGKPTPAAAMQANKDSIDYWTAAFPSQMKILAGSANDIAGMQSLILYGVQKTGGKFLYKMNALSEKVPTNWDGMTIIRWAIDHGAQGGFEMLCGASANGGDPTRFGSSNVMDGIAKGVQVTGKPVSGLYLAIYPPDLGGVH